MDNFLRFLFMESDELKNRRRGAEEEGDMEIYQQVYLKNRILEESYT